MTPDECHNDPRNWSDGLVDVYFARDDPRLWVNPRHSRIGWRMNYAHPKAGLITQIVSILAVPVTILIVHANHGG